MLLDGGRKYLGGIEELVDLAERTVAPPFDRSKDDATDWVAVARRECEVSRFRGVMLVGEPRRGMFSHGDKRT